MSKYMFVWAHASLIKWYTAFSESFRMASPDNKVILFVHGREDVEIGKQYDVFDEVVDIIDGFVYNPDIKVTDLKISKNIVELEEHFNDNFFWEDVKVDRFIRAKKDKSFIVQYLNFAVDKFMDYYKKYAPVLGFGESTMAIYRLTKRIFERDELPYLCAIGTRYFSRYSVDDDWYWNWDLALENYRKYLTEDIPQDILDVVVPVYERIITKKQTTINFDYYKKNLSIGYNKLSSNSFSTIIQKWKAYRKLNEQKEELVNNVRYSQVDSSLLKKFTRVKKAQKDHAAYAELVLNEIPNVKFCSFFLHFQPEYTVDSLGKFFIEQNYLVKNIASALPADMYLVVKDHPTMVGVRDVSFYEDILSNKNVLLLNDKISSYEVIKQSKLVFTIVGTAALEAMFMGIPAIMFGKYAFNNTNTISFSPNFWDLPELVRKKLLEKYDPAEVKKHALALLAGKYAGSLEGQLPVHPDLDDAFADRSPDYFIVRDSFMTELRRRKIID